MRSTNSSLQIKSNGSRSIAAAGQAFVNLCVVTGLMPNTGLTLPFVSYGLSSLVSLFMGVGMVLNVGLQQETQG